MRLRHCEGAGKGWGYCCRKEKKKNVRWFGLLLAQKEGSPLIKLTTLLVPKGMAIFDRVYSWERRVRQLQQLPPQFNLLIPGLVTGWQRATVVKGEEGHSSSHL